jgi:hypothetical protein
MAYFSIYGQSGNKTTAIIAARIAENNHVLGSRESNLKLANLDLAFFSDFYNYFGYLSLVMC